MSSTPSLIEKMSKVELASPTTATAAEVLQPQHGQPEVDLMTYEISKEDTRALLWTLDTHIAPVVMILYLIAFLDRANIGNAAVGGMTADLNFPANGLSVATSIFYVTYVLLETPATIVLRTLRPSRMISAVTVIWGVFVLANGFARNYPTVIALRLVLGACEAALSPCLALYMTTFYRREELGLRLCYLYSSSCLSGIVGGLIAAGFLKMDGLAGYAGWQWLYIIEGAITIIIGFGVYFAIADQYTDAKYLSEHQMFLMHVRHAQAAAYSKDDGFSWVEIRKAFTDPVIWLSGFIQLCVDTCLYGFSTFLVVIVNQLGFDRIASQGITAPVYFFAALSYYVGAILSDRLQTRYWVLLPLMLVTTTGYIILVAATSVPARLAACFLTGSGIYIAVGLHVTWLGQNIAGYRKRSTSVGMQQTIGNIGGVIAGQIYRSVDQPRYLPGNAASLGFWVVGIIALTCEMMIWRTRNKRRENMSDEEKDARDAKGIDGDHHHSFRYVL